MMRLIAAYLYGRAWLLSGAPLKKPTYLGNVTKPLIIEIISLIVPLGYSKLIDCDLFTDCFVALECSSSLRNLTGTVLAGETAPLAGRADVSM